MDVVQEPGHYPCILPYFYSIFFKGSFLRTLAHRTQVGDVQAGDVQVHSPVCEGYEREDSELEAHAVTLDMPVTLDAFETVPDRVFTAGV